MGAHHEQVAAVGRPVDCAHGAAIREDGDDLALCALQVEAAGGLADHGCPTAIGRWNVA
jgi:hypothetical protein